MQNVSHHFPALNRPLERDGKPTRLAFLDSGASAQKPTQVLQALQQAYAGPYANIHRGVYENSQKTTTAYEEARAMVAGFLGCRPAEIIFTKNSTEAINLVARTWGKANLKAGDVVVLTELEHHANIVPWQLLREETGIILRPIRVAEDGSITPAAIDAALSEGPVKLLALTGMSNVCGVMPPLAHAIQSAHAIGAKVLVDGSQLTVHHPVNLKTLGADFYTFTGHKLYGPTGVGVLAVKADIQETMPPFLGGGDMIEKVTFAHTTFAPPPARFEAGTPAIAEAIGLAAAVAFVQNIGWETIENHEKTMAALLEKTLEEAGVTRYGKAGKGNGIAAFNIPGTHPSDVAQILDACGVAVRCGHHCAMPLMQAWGIDGCVRATVALYTQPEDIAQLAEGLHKAKRMLTL